MNRRRHILVGHTRFCLLDANVVAGYYLLPLDAVSQTEGKTIRPDGTWGLWGRLRGVFVCQGGCSAGSPDGTSAVACDAAGRLLSEWLFIAWFCCLLACTPAAARVALVAPSAPRSTKLISPSGKGAKTDEGHIRAAAVRYSIAYLTTIRTMEAAVQAMQTLRQEPIEVETIQDRFPHLVRRRTASVTV